MTERIDALGAAAILAAYQDLAILRRAVRRLNIETPADVEFHRTMHRLTYGRKGVKCQGLDYTTWRNGKDAYLFLTAATSPEMLDHWCACAGIKRNKLVASAKDTFYWMEGLI